ncbi:MAG: helix-turn-helix transcriptional regulator [Anaerolineae bacterium]|nr:helix-turn-helix transcriptional regulator [Anaerolineae bacterium]
MQRFGEKLRTLRQRQGLSIRQLATALEVNAHSHIAKIETGQSHPSADLILKIARFFDVSIDQLMKDELELD